MAEVFGDRNTQLLAMIIGEADCTMRVLCLTSPNRQFQAASFPQISEEEEPKPRKRLCIVYLLFLNESNGN